ncbi:MAG: sodium:calcium antiporter [Planctomycetales bacterium]|nr:sodium:calcium antiporter [Planctomycetales bacterium]
MLLLVLQFIGLAAVIVIFGIMLAKYADAIADITGLGRTLAGLVLLAAATSLPELAVDCSFALSEAPDFAVGALVGSSLFNLLILGVMDFSHRYPDRIFSAASSKHILSASTSLLLTGVVILFLVLSQQNLKFVWNGFGLGPFVIFVLYVLSLRMVYMSEKEEEEEASADGMTLRRALIGYLVTTAIIFFAASALAPTSEKLAEVTGLGGTFVGSTFVALTTSLPELVTTAAAVRMGSFDLAIGNVLGSNNFNMAILFPVDCVYRKGTLLGDAELSHAITGCIVMVITAIAILSMVYRPRKRNVLLDPGAGMVVVLAILAISALYYLSPASTALPAP